MQLAFNVCFCCLVFFVFSMLLEGVPIFIDNGLLRADEAKQVKATLQTLGLDNLQCHDCSERFLKVLDGVLDADERRVSCVK